MAGKGKVEEEDQVTGFRLPVRLEMVLVEFVLGSGTRTS